MFLVDPVADLEPLGIVECNGHGWKLTASAERDFGPALRELDARCRELEALGASPHWATVLVLHGDGALCAEDASPEGSGWRRGRAGAAATAEGAYADSRNSSSALNYRLPIRRDR